MSIKVKGNVFLLNTCKTSYVMGIDSNGILSHLYWGRKIEQIDDFEFTPLVYQSGFHEVLDMTPEECSSFGMMRYTETSMKVRFSDGVRDFRYKVKEYEANGDILSITLQDEYYPFEVKLYYQVFEDADIIKKWRVAMNTGTDDIVLESFYSGEYPISGTDYEIINYNGKWEAEFKKYSEKICSGKKVYESTRGITAHVSNPMFIVHRDAKENFGDVYFGALEYSGNYKVVAEATPYESVNVLIGISDTDFAWVLKSGESFESPAVYAGYSANGFEDMSHTLHSFCFNELMPRESASRALPVIYNSWMATEFNVQCNEQMQLAEKAAAIGAELFVVDDGWFGNRNDDYSSLGDWYVNAEKFPNGLEELISHVKKLGMKFGIWVEPEMVNRDSDLFREHPEWAYQFNNREILEGRHQLALDLTNEEVVNFIIEFLDELLTKYEIDYIKWDMNRAISESVCYGTSIDEMKQVWVKNTQSFYRIIKEVRRKHPNVEYEACASGGGRVDYGAMRFFDEYWPSDNTDALDRLEIQHGYSYIYPIKYMRAWVSDNSQHFKSRKIPLSFRLSSAMAGSLGISNDLNKMPAEDIEILKGGILQYKRIRDVVQFGTFYRLKNFKSDDFHAIQFVHGKSCVVFAYLINERFRKKSYNVRLRGLNTEKTYAILCNGEEYKKSGAYCMNHGLDITLQGDYDSIIIEMKELG